MMNHTMKYTRKFQGATSSAATRCAGQILFVALVSFGEFSCGGSSSSNNGSACLVPGACGGNLDGTWQVDSACANGDMVAALNANSALPAACHTLYQSVAYTLSGTVTYASSTETRDVTTTLSTEAVYTQACFSAEGGGVLNATSCTNIQNQAAASGKYASATCAYSGDVCRCSLVSDSTDTSALVYTISGNQIVYANGDPPSNYCVSGTTLTSFSPGQSPYQNLTFVGTARRMP